MRAIADIKGNEKVMEFGLFVRCCGCNTYAGVIYNGRRSMHFVMSDDEKGWEHVSVSFTNELLYKRGELPSWSEMAMVKDIFWDAEEEVYQIHPPKSEYVNIAEVLHLWRPKNGRRLEEILG